MELFISILAGSIVGKIIVEIIKFLFKEND